VSGRSRDAVLGERADVLGAAWRRWATTLAALPAAAWTRPTRLEGWDVHALVAHHAMFAGALTRLAARPVGGEPAVRTARDMLRGFNAPGGNAYTLAPAVADLARSQAGAQPPEALVERFTVDAPAALDAVRAAGPIVVEYFGNGTFPIAEVLAIGILEAVVHGLDLAHAVETAPDVPPQAVQFTVGLLAELAEPVAFVEAATGRVATPVLPVLR
jgi:uncharacterized protein (TIGR03083 family)